MDEIIKNLGTASWWFGVVFVGILVSLIASFVKPKIDAWLAIFSRSRREANEQKQNKWNEEVDRLVEKEEFRTFYLAKISHAHGQSTFFMLMGMSMFFLGNIISIIFQLPHMVDSEEVSKAVEFITSLPEEKITYITRLVLYNFGALCILVGMREYKVAQINKELLKESIEKMANNGN